MWEIVLFFLWYVRFMWESKIQLVLESLQDECSLVSNSYLQYLHDIKIPLKYTSLKRAIAKCCLTHCQWAQPVYLLFVNVVYDLVCTAATIPFGCHCHFGWCWPELSHCCWPELLLKELTATSRCAQLGAVSQPGSRGTALLLAKASSP